MKKINVLIIIVFIGLSFSSCETVNLNDGEINPNAIQESKSDIGLILNGAQVSFRDFFYDISDLGRRNTRMINQFGSYSNDIPTNDATLNQAWTNAYAGVLRSCQLVYKKDTGDYPYYRGMAEVLEAYTMVTLVDFFGDVPYSQALGTGSFPAPDAGADVYNKMLIKLDHAITLFNQTSPNIPNDVFYVGASGTTGNPMYQWIKVANSLKLKIYTNLRLTIDVSGSVNQIIASGDYINSNADDFNFKYSSNISPDSRHPDFTSCYISGTSSFMSNSYLLLMTRDKAATPTTTYPDPRLRYYFYRQSTTSPSGTNLPCQTDPNIKICSVNTGNIKGYYGRDHADQTGIPNIALRNTIYGLYPAGGRYDNDYNKSVTSAGFNAGANGQGILNILDYSYIQFMLAELALTVPGVTGSPSTYLQTGVTNNISKVMNFRPDLMVGLTPVPSAGNVTSYISKVVSLYATASSPQDKLNIIIKEFYISCFGNGVEAYNMYRRTGFPAHSPNFIGMQSPVYPAGTFPRTMFYPNNEVINNQNLPQHTASTQVFWDNNAPNFID